LRVEVRNPDAACYQSVWNFAVGCDHVDRGCKNCCVQHLAGTYWQFAEKGVTQFVKGRYVWNGQVWIAPPDSDVWLEPQLIPGSDQFIFVNLMSDVCHEAIPPSITRLAFWSIAASRHLGMFCTKRVDRMAALMASATPEEARLWKPKSLLGFSCFDQPSFDQRWPIMRALAEAGFAVYASLSPLLGPITLPADYLALARWTIVSGEQGPHERVRDMDPAWARAVRDQCDQAGIPFFLREMSRGEIIPNDLLRRDFPSLKLHSQVINIRGTSGSGKSTLVRQWLNKYPSKPLFGVLGRCRPEAYACAVPGVKYPLYVLGPYETPCGGCDAKCLKRVQQRRAERGDRRPFNRKNTITHFWQSLHSKRVFEAKGSRATWLDLSAEETNAAILRMLTTR
jgi:protein gp37